MVLGRMLLRTTAGERRLWCSKRFARPSEVETPSSRPGVSVAFFIPFLLSPRSNIIYRRRRLAASPRVRAANDITRASDFPRKRTDLPLSSLRYCQLLLELNKNYIYYYIM